MVAAATINLFFSFPYCTPRGIYDLSLFLSPSRFSRPTQVTPLSFFFLYSLFFVCRLFLPLLSASLSLSFPLCRLCRLLQFTDLHHRYTLHFSISDLPSEPDFLVYCPTLNDCSPSISNTDQTLSARGCSHTGGNLGTLPH